MTKQATRRLALMVVAITGLALFAVADDAERPQDSPAPATAVKAVSSDAVIDAFVESLRQNSELELQQRAEVTAAVEEMRKDPFGVYEAITVGLGELHPEYQQALVAMAQENLEAAEPVLRKYAASKDPYLAADASYYLSRALILSDRYDDALPLLENVTSKLADKTVLAGEAKYMRGVCEARLLKRDAAIATFDQYLKENPDAPERMKIGAMRQLEQLRQFQPETIADVYERMDLIRRKLAQQESGDETQQQQDAVIDILAKLIKEAEEKECNCAGGGEGEGKQSQGKNGDGEGEAEGGDGEGGQNASQGPVVKKTYRGPRSPWSQIRDKERDPAYSAIKEKFPARYEKLIEQYYRSFDEE
ncbi:MAG: tetratricopeptide repeat protein [Pirellulaceae bacterium]